MKNQCTNLQHKHSASAMERYAPCCCKGPEW